MQIRMPSINKVIITGNLVRDPDTRILENGTHMAKMSIAISLDIDQDKIHRAGIALGAVGPTVIRAEKAESMLAGSSIHEPDTDAVASAAMAAACPIDDFRSSRDYRFRMTKIATVRLLGRLLNKN